MSLVLNAYTQLESAETSPGQTYLQAQYLVNVQQDILCCLFEQSKADAVKNHNPLTIGMRVYAARQAARLRPEEWLFSFDGMDELHEVQ